MSKINIIKLTPGKPCKCSCREYITNNGKSYWIDKNIVYSTDCHKKAPLKAKGIFILENKTIEQL